MKKLSLPTREYLFDASLALTVICLCAAYIMAGLWPGALCAGGLGTLWFVTRRREPSWLPHIHLVLSLALAAAAILTGGPSVPAILASGLALVAWDINMLMYDLRGSQANASTRRFEHRHLQMVLMAAAAGLLIALIGRLIRLDMPFIVMVVLILLMLFALDRLRDLLNHNR